MTLPDEILERFRDGLDAAVEAGEKEPTAMTVATLDGRGGVSARTVLLKEHGPDGFVFYTNSHSIKGKQIAANDRVALVVLWKQAYRQVLIEGRASFVGDAEADEYFSGRPRGSQVGAWASLQSEPLDRRETLEERVREIEQRFEGREVPRPPHWRGYRVTPDMVEFWYGRESRLHDRFRFTLDGDGHWQRQRLYP